ncbi:MAG: hypothetical protein JO235_04925 [Chroococcidiopsidaceae cyanobacterium CP_BM_RX_35]|nr:hypothetical protein [Chroococcidiopsidaceae cyanobacterium CP_BM_RX_35]
MNQKNSKPTPVPIGHDFIRFIAAVAGGIVAYIITSNLPRLDSAIACAVVIALTSFANTRLSHPTLWWSHLGAIAGGVVGTGTVLADTVAQAGLSHQTEVRYTIVGYLGLAGLVSGIFLGRDFGKAHVPTLGEFLKGASALTAGAFAVIVTIKFILAGIEPARSLSSRLSTTTTTLVTSLAAPGWIGYLVGRLRLSRKGKPPRGT